MPGNTSAKSIYFLAVLFLLFSSLSGTILYGETMPELDIWEALVSKYVNEEGLVFYREWKENPLDLARLEEFIGAIANSEVDLETPSANLLPLLLNAYNAFVVEEVLSHYPLQSFRDIPRVFTQKKHWIGGKELSLNELEERILEFGDFRVLAAMVNASRSSAPLRREAYTQEKFSAQLDEQMKRWLSDKRWNDLLPQNGSVKLSKVISWYKREFGGSDEAVRGKLAQYGPEQFQRISASQVIRLDFLDYEWSLNEAFIHKQPDADITTE